jgi:hypothetical protein
MCKEKNYGSFPIFASKMHELPKPGGRLARSDVGLE